MCDSRHFTTPESLDIQKGAVKIPSLLDHLQLGSVPQVLGWCKAGTSYVHSKRKLKDSLVKPIKRKKKDLVTMTYTIPHDLEIRDVRDGFRMTFFVCISCHQKPVRMFGRQVSSCVFPFSSSSGPAPPSGNRFLLYFFHEWVLVCVAPQRNRGTPACLLHGPLFATKATNVLKKT